VVHKEKEALILIEKCSRREMDNGFGKSETFNLAKREPFLTVTCFAQARKTKS